MRKTVSKSDFQKFVDVLSMLKGNCIDVDISKGKIRQFSDNMMFIFQADITNIFDDNDIVLPMIDNKLPLLSMLIDNYSDNEIILDINNEKYTFSDGITDLSFVTMSSKQYLDNKYIDDNEFSKYVDESGDIIFSCNLSKSILNKINVCSNNFNVQDIQVILQNNLAEFQLYSFNMTNSAKIIGDIPTQNFNGKISKEIFSVKPFRIDFKNDIEFKLFYNGNSKEKVINHIFSNNDININIYAPGCLNENF